MADRLLLEMALIPDDAAPNSMAWRAAAGSMADGRTTGCAMSAAALDESRPAVLVRDGGAQVMHGGGSAVRVGHGTEAGARCSSRRGAVDGAGAVEGGGGDPTA